MLKLNLTSFVMLKNSEILNTFPVSCYKFAVSLTGLTFVDYFPMPCLIGANTTDTVVAL